MPTIRLLLLITGNLRTCNDSICRTAFDPITFVRGNYDHDQG